LYPHPNDPASDAQPWSGGVFGRSKAGRDGGQLFRPVRPYWSETPQFIGWMTTGMGCALLIRRIAFR